MLHQLVQGSLWVIDKTADPINYLADIMRGHIGCHAHSNTHRAIDQQIWKMAWEHNRLFQAVVIIGPEIYGILVDIIQHGHRKLGHSRLGISGGGGGVPVYRAKVAVAIYQHIPEGKVLGQAYHGVIYRGIAMGVELCQSFTHSVHTFAVGAVRPKGILVHFV